MSFTWFIAKRYLWSKRRHPFVGVVSTISVVGILVGVAALVTVLAVMNGFDDELKSRLVGMRAHLIIEKEGAFTEADAVRQKISTVKGVRASAPYVEGQALLQSGDWGAGVLVRGIDAASEKNVTQFFRYMIQGSFGKKLDGIVIGTEMAKHAHLSTGSSVSIATQALEKPAVFTVEGIFSSGMYEYDANLVFLTIPQAQKIFSLNGQVSGLSVAWKSAEDADNGKRILQKELGYPFYVRSWTDMNRTLFSALALEKLVMFLILGLIILVACLNIAGSLTILVMDKTKEIGVLKALGAAPSDLLKIFAWDGLALGLVGAFSGLAAGLVLCIGLKQYAWIQLPKEIYYVDRLPVLVDFKDTATVVLVAVVLSFVSALYPARMAARLDPVKALRYE